MIMNEMYGIHYYKDDKNIIWVDAADTAKEIGLVDERKSGIKAGYCLIRWARFNRYISEYATSGVQNIITVDCAPDGNIDVKYPVKSGDYIPIMLAFLVAMKADSKKAREFQRTLLYLIDYVNKQGVITGNPMLDMRSNLLEESPTYGTKRNIINSNVRKYARANKLTFGQAFNKLYETMENIYGINNKEYANGKRQILTNGINMYGSAAGINRGEANKRFQKCFDDMNGTRIKQRAKNYGKKKGVKNMSVNQYIDEHDMYDKAGDALYHLVYGLYEFAKMDVAPNNNQQMNDDGYYHPENDWHIIASVVWTDQGTRITCETWENGLGTREQRVRKEQI